MTNQASFFTPPPSSVNTMPASAIQAEINGLQEWKKNYLAAYAKRKQEIAEHQKFVADTDSKIEQLNNVIKQNPKHSKAQAIQDKCLEFQQARDKTATELVRLENSIKSYSQDLQPKNERLAELQFELANRRRLEKATEVANTVSALWNSLQPNPVASLRCGS